MSVQLAWSISEDFNFPSNYHAEPPWSDFLQSSFVADVSFVSSFELSVLPRDNDDVSDESSCLGWESWCMSLMDCFGSLTAITRISQADISSFWSVSGRQISSLSHADLRSSSTVASVLAAWAYSSSSGMSALWPEETLPMTLTTPLSRPFGFEGARDVFSSIISCWGYDFRFLDVGKIDETGAVRFSLVPVTFLPPFGRMIGPCPSAWECWFRKFRLATGSLQ